MRAKIRGTEIYFDVDGAGLALAEDKTIERPVIFLLHGGPGADHTGFKHHTSPIRDIAQLVFIDHRGSGRSAQGDPSTYTLDNNIDDVEALRQHLGLERISVFGTSYGGMVAQGYAIRYPDRVANLVLCVTAPSHRFLADAQRIVRQRGTPEQVRVCQRLWDGSFENQEQVREFARVMGPMYAVKFDPAKFEQGWARAPLNHVQINRGFGGFLRTFDYTEELHKIACPTLVLGAAHDWICAPNHSQLMAERIPRAHLKIFANSGHFLATDESEAYLAALRGFFTYAPR